MISKSPYWTLYLLLLLLIFLQSCQNQKPLNPSGENEFFGINDFDVLENYTAESSNNIKSIDLDYFNSMKEGFIIPTSRQIASGYFTFSFSVLNKSDKPASYAYKIYYQNESYKFPELDSTTGKLHKLSHENFYGSWDDSTYEFKNTIAIPADGKYHIVKDSIRIVGNPRYDELYYENGINNRWQRNPRVGVYSFMLAVSLADSVSLKEIPAYIKNICLKNGEIYETPYFYFKNGAGSKSKTLVAAYSQHSLKVIARPDLGSGIYIKGGHFDEDSLSAYSRSDCASDTFLFRTAAFAQFIHYIDASTNLENIPVIKDVLKDGYSKRDYNWNRSFYAREELISTRPRTASIPCQTVYSDSINKKITIHNPKSEEGKWRKENVGIISRHGMCYGKIRVKAKLTQLLNKENMWNGLTNAIWMINQEGGNGQWNLRRACNKEGYMETYWGGRNDKRVNRVGYSEIDFEILKTPSYCPVENFPPVYKLAVPDPGNEASWNVPWPDEITRHDADITVACTNWDMACWEPENFGVGCNPVTYEGKTFETHRWDHWYRAITEKTYAPDDSLFASDYYYFEIEWKPAEIIWRIGPEPDKMKVVGYMNDKVTSVPNNQMVLIVTQEFHNTNWWPGSPYQQSYIPFPLNDIYGEILEVVIE